MKKKFKVNMILSIVFISIFYSFVVGVKPANATCVDVTKDPCFCGLFDVPIGTDTMGTAWWGLYFNNTKSELNYLRTQNLMVDTCNLLEDYKKGLVCSDPYSTEGWNRLDYCVYLKFLQYSEIIPYGFNKTVINGDTVEISDLDVRNTKLLNELNLFKSTFCNLKIIIYEYDLTKNKIAYTLMFENHVQILELVNFFLTMNIQYSAPLIFSPVTNIVSNQNQNDSFLINQQNDELKISADFTFESTEIEIYDVLGICQIRSEMNSSAKVLDISGLPRGVYFVKIGDIVEKFVKM